MKRSSDAPICLAIIGGVLISGSIKLHDGITRRSFKVKNNIHSCGRNIEKVHTYEFVR